MMRHRHLTFAITALLFASHVAAQQSQGDVKLSANEMYVEFSPAAASATLIPFHVEVNGRDTDGFDVAVSNPAAVVSVIMPNGTEIDSANAASFGYEWELMAADSEAVTSGLVISRFSVPGTH